MGFQSRWQDLPRDARWGYLVTLGYVLALAMVVLAGSLTILLFGCLLYVVLLLVLILVFNLVRGLQRTERVVPLVLLVTCMILQCGGSPLGAVRLHLIVSIYRAGGPDALIRWAQALMSEPYIKPDESQFLEYSQIPEPIRTYLPGRVSVGDTIWSDLVRVRIELGGGFFHYGVVIYPSAHAPPSDWWQRLLHWPPEVVPYQGGG